MNIFQLFEIPISFKPDKSLLRKQYLNLSRKFHPDHFANKSETERTDAMQTAATINDAYKILQNDFLLMEYILKLKGVLTDDEKNTLPQAFMMEMMDLNEMLADAKFEGYDEAAKKIITDEEEKVFATIQPIIQNYNDETITTAELEKIKEYYLKKKYFNKLKLG